MASINDQPGNGNPTNKASGGTSCEEAGAANSAEGEAHITEELKTTVAADEIEPETDRMNGEAARLEDRVDEHTEETASTSGARVSAALASLRAFLDEHGASPQLESALVNLEDAVRRRGAENTDGGDDSAPASGRRRADECGDEHAPTSGTLPPSLSTLALRLNDGAMLVTLEDADDRDLSGRVVIRCMVLSNSEGAGAFAILEGPLADAAANIIGSLPKRAS